jgi:anti-sigma regulatory factor (Ser/Thr protein kinase)
MAADQDACFRPWRPAGGGATLRVITPARDHTGRNALMNPQTTTAPLAEPASTPRAKRARRRAWRQLSVTLPAGRLDLIAPTRHLVLANVTEWGAGPQSAGDIELCVSELLTNAAVYSQGPARLELFVQDGTVRVQVSDTSSKFPRDLGDHAQALEEHGKGLHIVKALASEVSVEVRGWGKTVTAVFWLR